MFVDPLGQFQLDVPLGWGYDVESSDVTSVVFRPPDRVDERLVACAMPARPDVASDDEWQALVAKRFLLEGAPITQLRCGDGIAIRGAGPGEGERVDTLVARGVRLDLLVQHIVPEPWPAEGSSPLSRICRTLIVPSDPAVTVVADQTRVIQALDSAAGAAAVNDWSTAALDASRALAAARGAYLATVTDASRFPEVAAVLSVLDALVLRGHAERDLLTLREGDLLLSRAERTIARLPDLPRVRRRQMLTEMAERRRGLHALQLSMLRPAAGDQALPLPILRSKSFLHSAGVLFEGGNTEAALHAAERAVDDILLLQVKVLRASDDAVARVPAGVRAKLEQVGEGLEEQGALAKRIVNRMVLDEIAGALRTLGTIRRAVGDADGSLDAAKLLVSISRTLDRPEATARGEIRRTEGYRRHVAAAMLDEIEHELSRGEMADVAVVRWRLEDVDMMLDELKDGGVLRIKHRLLRDRVAGATRPQLSQATLTTLATWALGPTVPTTILPRPTIELPSDVATGTPATVVRWALTTLPESDAAKFWLATDANATPESMDAASVLIGEWLPDPDWRHGWAIAALRALDDGQPLQTRGRLQGLEYARACLVAPSTLIDYALGQSRETGRTGARVFDQAPVPKHSPFGDTVVREVLTALDAVVAAQEAAPDRLAGVLGDLNASPHPEMALAAHIVTALPPGSIFRHAVALLAVGGALGTILRREHEIAEHRRDFSTMQALDSVLIRVAARYGATVDFVLAVHRTAAATARRVKQLEVLSVLEHLLIGAVWLGDAAVEAVCQHGVALVWRDDARKIPGVIDAIAAFQRASTLRDQLGDSVAAAGALIDLAALLVGYHAVLQHVEEGRDWAHFADRYLAAAIARLTEEQPPTATALQYLGEAFQNRARLRLGTNDRVGAASDAGRSIGFALATESRSLEERARKTLALAVDDADKQAVAAQALPELLSDVQADLAATLGNRAAAPLRRELFSTVLEMLLEAVGTTLEEPTAGQLLLTELESARGYTYNRWLGDVPTAHIQRVKREAALDRSCPVIAAYVIAERRAAIIVIDRDEPVRVLPIDITAGDLEPIVESHLRGLVKQGRLRGEEPWSTFQEPFIARLIPIVAPLEPYIAAGRTLCLVPHRTLHGAALHTLPTAPGGEPIGLRTPVFTNPSVTNWLSARAAAVTPSWRAFAGCTSPADELQEFGDAAVVSGLLSEAGIEVVQPAPAAVDLAALAASGASPWTVLHLSSHGVFEPDNLEIGLLLASGGVLPPPPERSAAGRGTAHLARPHDLRESGVRARLAFLASCVSSRNEAYIGDDLMGVTRAWFAGGTADLIAGAWTVVSSCTGIFARRFYERLLAGRPVAEAVLSARQAVAASHPDPFYWGVFLHQGANATLADAPGSPDVMRRSRSIHSTGGQDD